MKMTKRAICLLLAAVMALALTVPVLAMDEPAAAAAKNGKVRLDAGKGQFTNGSNEYSVDVTDGQLPDLEPTRTGWKFVGWYDGEITEKLDKTNPKDEATYWKWNITSNGNRVSTISEKTDTLYAMYEPEPVKYTMYSCGWNHTYRSIEVTRQYGVPFCSVPAWEEGWNGFVFDGWYTSLEDDSGQHLIAETDETDNGTPVDGSFQKVYLHWHAMDDPNIKQKYDVDPGFFVDSKLQSLGLSDWKNTIHPYEFGAQYLLCTFEASITTTPAKANVEGIKWTSQPEGIVKITSLDNGGLGNSKGANGARARITGLKEGTATVTVSVGGISTSRQVTVKHDKYLANSHPASCTTPGSEQWKCYSCNYFLNKTLPAEHSYTIVDTFPATCTTPGSTVKTCHVCGDKITTTTPDVPATGHQYTETKKTTCGVTVTTSTCTKCGHIEVVESGGPATHSWDPEYTVDKDATCISLGSRSRHCMNDGCPAVTDVEDIPASGSHSYGPWRITKTPHYKETGLKERTCTVCGAKQTEILPEDDNVPGTYPSYGGGGGGGAAPEETPTPTPSETPSPSPEPSPEPGTTPEPVPVPVDPPKTENGSGWSYDYDTGDYYYFVEGEPKANYWAMEEAASQWGYWYYVGSDGKLATGLQYIENSNGTGWYFLQPDTTNGCIGRMLTGWQWIGPEAGTGWFNTAHGGVNGQCTYTTEWGDYNASDNTWGKDHIAH